jgi:aspartate kinase
MLNMASLGAKVLQIRSVGVAKKYNIPVHVRSSFSEEEGTMVVQEDSVMEQLVVSGVTHDLDQARITLKKCPISPALRPRYSPPSAESGILVDMIIQNTRAAGQTDLTFTVPKADYQPGHGDAEKDGRKNRGGGGVRRPNIAKVSVIGVGMKNHSGVASLMFNALSRENINIIMISTSEIRISCIIEEKYTELAVRVLHTAFGLDRED